MASYDKTQPQDEDLGVSQTKLALNSAAIEEYIARDHVSFDDNTTKSGLHKQVTFEDQHTPVGASSANQGILYIENSEADLNFMNSSGTAQKISGFAQTLTSTGSAELPGGLIIKWGTVTLPNLTTLQGFTFASAFPNAIFSGTITQKDSTGSGSYGIYSLLTTGFSVKRTSSSGAINYNYIIIGN